MIIVFNITTYQCLLSIKTNATLIPPEGSFVKVLVGDTHYEVGRVLIDMSTTINPYVTIRLKNPKNYHNVTYMQRLGWELVSNDAKNTRG